MSERENKHGWAFWLTVTLIALPVLYVASFGPACWITSRVADGATVVDFVYQPLMRMWRRWSPHAESDSNDLLARYANFSRAPGRVFWLTGDESRGYNATLLTPDFFKSGRPFRDGLSNPLGRCPTARTTGAIEMADERKRASVGFRATLILLLQPALYVVSSGPVQWLDKRVHNGLWRVR